MAIASIKFSTLLFGMAQLLRVQARRHPAYRERLKERNLVAQIKARDEEIGRWFSFTDGKIRTGRGMHKSPDVTLGFKSAAHGVDLLTPPINWLKQINAQK